MKRWFSPGGRKGHCPRPKRALARYRYVRLRWRVLFSLIDLVGWLAMGAWRMLAWPRRNRNRQEAKPPRSILIVQLDHLGDAILSTGLLRGIRHAYPSARLDVLASESNAELFRACSEVDRVIVSRTNRLSRVTRAGWLISMLFWGLRLRRNCYDLGIDVRGEFPAAVILWLSGARRRIGWGCGGGGFLLTDRPAFVWGRHEVRSRQAQLDILGIAPPAKQSVWAPSLTIEPRWQRWAAEQLPPRAANQSLVVVHCGAGTKAKQWPLEHWQELVGRLRVELDSQVILVGGGGDVARAQAILDHRDWPGVTDLTGRLSLVQLAALVERADVLVGADSGPAHLAAALGTPVVALFSGTNRAEQWRPWGERVSIVRHGASCAPCHNEQCPLADHPCMTQLLASDVLSAIAAWLVPARSASPIAPKNRGTGSPSTLISSHHKTVGERILT